MSKEEGHGKTKAPVNLENLTLQVAVEQSIVLPKDSLAKANPVNPTPNISALQAETKQCASLPQNRRVGWDSIDKSTEQS